MIINPPKALAIIHVHVHVRVVSHTHNYTHCTIPLLSMQYSFISAFSQCLDSYCKNHCTVCIILINAPGTGNYHKWMLHLL